MTPVGFEPTQLALVELESTPLDHSGKVSMLLDFNLSVTAEVAIAVHVAGRFWGNDDVEAPPPAMGWGAWKSVRSGGLARRLAWAGARLATGG